MRSKALFKQIRPARRQRPNHFVDIQVLVPEHDVELIEDDEGEVRVCEQRPCLLPARLGGGDVELPAVAPRMIARIGPVEAVSQVGYVDASVRRTDRIPEEETGGIILALPTSQLILEYLVFEQSDRKKIELDQ
mgnify:CR=1 FL=1